MRQGKPPRKAHFSSIQLLFQIIIFHIHIILFHSSEMFFGFLYRKTLQNDYEITSKSKFWNQQVYFWYLHHPALSNSLTSSSAEGKSERIFRRSFQSILMHFHNKSRIYSESDTIDQKSLNLFRK